MAQTIRPSYTVKQIEIDHNDLDMFSPDTNRRKVRPSVVKAIYHELQQGQHFQTPISVNEVEGEWELFDGHHRMDAVARYLKEDEDNKVTITLHVYDNLDEEEVKEEYTRVNKGTKQNTNDVVRQYEDDIPIFQMMKNGWQHGGTHYTFPCGVGAYPSSNNISFYRLVSAYFAATSPNWQGGYMASAFQFVDEAMELGVEELMEITAFMNDFIEAFGNINNNPFLRSTPFTALFKIWIDNRDTIPPHLMVKRWKDKLYGNHQALELGKSGGSGATKVCRDMYKTLINNGRRRYIFV